MPMIAIASLVRPRGRFDRGPRRLAVLITLTLGLLFAACGDSESGARRSIDVKTPVQDLAGYDDLLHTVALSSDADHGLASWVDVFRNGLDILYRTEDGTKLQTDLQDWWAEAPKAMESIVGSAHVQDAMTWLDQQYGPDPRAKESTR